MKAWMSITGEEPLQLVRIRDDFFGYADMNDGFLRLIVIDGDFEREFFALADTFLSEGGVFLDVGANYGLLSCGLAGRHGSKLQFHLFEPNLRLVASIERSLAIYPGIQYRVNASAVSDRDGVVGFRFNHIQTGMSHITNDTEETVPSITLDRYLLENNIDRVELLKIDVEGYELSVLRGASRSLETRRIQAVYFEYFEKWLRRTHQPSVLLEFLASLGYLVCFCRRSDIVPRGGATHAIRAGLHGQGIPLVPIAGHHVPEMTDLLAIPEENLVRKVAKV